MPLPMGLAPDARSYCRWICHRRCDTLSIGGLVLGAYATADGTRSPCVVLLQVVMRPPMRPALHRRSSFGCLCHRRWDSLPIGGPVSGGHATADATRSPCAVLFRVLMPPPMGLAPHRRSCFGWSCHHQCDSLPMRGPISRAYATADATRSPCAVLFRVLMPPPMGLAPYRQSCFGWS